ncbi:hypothetical protein H310_00040 [Aphanomyces invadans]|uniref:Uncharacterized protein n=1 Tax=Aphanomyces invadans TaxID=157072 RepID=A0A024USZ1_9STRA|nr:hypothetical protein H310_00040 [Aphanomyces invadans]ETW09439.1 hypothetical protein H310_00040 [Aphanomyces invadans]|eukprot:XP_008860850.1 hypothetical protein H310_00040 [Aphanomyces invadans]
MLADIRAREITPHPTLHRRSTEDIVPGPVVVDGQHQRSSDYSLLHRSRHSEDHDVKSSLPTTSSKSTLQHVVKPPDTITFFLSVTDLNLQASKSATDQLLRGAMSFFGGKKYAAPSPSKGHVPQSLVHIDLQSRLRETLPFQTEKIRSPNPSYSLGISIPVVSHEVSSQVLCFSVVLTEEGNGKTVAYAELAMKDLVRKFVHGTSAKIHLPLKLLTTSNTSKNAVKKVAPVLTVKFARVVPQKHVLFGTEDNMMRAYAFYNGEYSTPVIATEEAEAVDSHASVPAQFLKEMVGELQASLDLWQLRYETKTPRTNERPNSLFRCHDPGMDRVLQDLHPPQDMLYASGFLESHLMALEAQVAEAREMMGLAQLLDENHVLFKASTAKEKRDTQAMPTNLCLSTFRLYTSQDATPLQRMRSMSMDLNDSTSAFINPPDTPTQTTPSNRRGAKLSTLQDELRQQRKKERSVSIDFTSTGPSRPEVGALVVDSAVRIVSCATPSADALPDQTPIVGLRDLEDELVQVATQLRHLLQMEVIPPPGAEGSSASSSSLLMSGRKSDILSLDDAVTTSTTMDENRSSSHGSSGDSGLKDDDSSTVGSDTSTSVLTRSARRGLQLSASFDATAKRMSKVRSDSIDWVKSRVRTESMEWGRSSRDLTGDSPAAAAAQTAALWTKWEQTKATYVFRKVVCVSQSVTVLVAAFLAKLESVVDVPMELEQLARIGFLVGWECILFAQGKEQRMLSDTFVAVKALDMYSITLVPEGTTAARVSFPTPTTIQVVVPLLIYHKLPRRLQHAKIQVHTVIFTQGLHEMQNLASLVNSSGFQLQGVVNRDSFQALQRYHRAFLDMQKEMDVHMRHRLNNETMLDSLMPLVGRNAKYNKALNTSTNTLMLLEAADIVRKLNGMRVTCCPTGVDHTALSATLEQARLLYSKRSANSNASTEDQEVIKPIANIMREYGVRIAIAMKNTGRFEYAFNSIQRKLLPDVYRPPTSTIQEMTSAFF